MSMMKSLFPGHVPMTDLELFQAFNIEARDEKGNLQDFWVFSKKWGQDTLIDNLDASDKIENDDASKKARLIELYRSRVEQNLPIFVEN